VISANTAQKYHATFLMWNRKDMPTTPTLTTPELNDAATAEAVCKSLEVLEGLYLYNHWIFSKIRPFIGDNILEVGAGIGNITQFLLNYSRVVALEPHWPSAQRAKNNFRSHGNIEVVQATLEKFTDGRNGDAAFDTVICLNVLEHIENDVLALRDMKNCLSDSGQIIILVPALKALFGNLDRSFGHYRRYNRRILRQRFQEAGLHEVKSFYMNMPGVLGWFLHSKILQRRQINPQSAQRFEKTVPYISAVESLVSPPLGQSLIMVGKPSS
jgi:SAM-dependent methyltransferase